MPCARVDTGPRLPNGVLSDGRGLHAERAGWTDGWLRRYVGRRLGEGWSPQQIAARLRRDYPQDMGKRISHETIYAAI